MVKPGSSLVMVFSQWCLRVAVRRWPLMLRERLHAEWLAELCAIDGPERGVMRITYAYNRIRFAASLVCSPGVNDELESRGWREHWRSATPVMKSTGMLLVIPWLSYIGVAALLYSLSMTLEVLKESDFKHYETTGVMVAIRAMGLLVGLAIAGFAGRAIGRRFPVPRASVYAPVLLGVGFTTVAPLALITGKTLLLFLIGVGTWLALVLALTRGLSRKSQNSWWQRGATGLACLAIGCLSFSVIAALDVTITGAEPSAVLWLFPVSILDLDWTLIDAFALNASIGELLDTWSGLATAMPLCAIFALAYTQVVPQLSLKDAS